MSKTTASPNIESGIYDAVTEIHDEGTPLRPPSPWRNSTAKTTIIKELQDEASDIHLFIGTFGPSDWKQVKFEQLREKYAQRYDKSKFRENLKRLLLHFQNNTGDFSAERTEEKWYTSPNNVSEGYLLLFSLYMDTPHSKMLQGIQHPWWSLSTWNQCRESDGTASDGG